MLQHVIKENKMEKQKFLFQNLLGFEMSIYYNRWNEKSLFR